MGIRLSLLNCYTHHLVMHPNIASILLVPLLVLLSSNCTPKQQTDVSSFLDYYLVHVSHFLESSERLFTLYFICSLERISRNAGKASLHALLSCHLWRFGYKLPEIHGLVCCAQYMVQVVWQQQTAVFVLLGYFEQRLQGFICTTQVVEEQNFYAGA